jgi:hypothetical protein
MVVTKGEAKEGARRWRRHKEEGGSEEDTSDGARDLHEEIWGPKWMGRDLRRKSEGEEKSESGDSSGESPESAAEADETYEEEERSNTEKREPRRRRNADNRVVSGDESESERSGERMRRRRQYTRTKRRKQRTRAVTWRSKKWAKGGM